MKKMYTLLLAVCCSGFTICCSGFTILNPVKTITGNDAQQLIRGAELIRTSDVSTVPTFIQFRKGSEVAIETFDNWFHVTFKINSALGMKLLSTETDKIGMQHYRYQETLNGFPMEGTMLIVHTKNNKVVSMNGMFFGAVSNVAAVASLNESSALQVALRSMNAESYRWESQQDEAQLKLETGNPNATYYPHGELFCAPLNGNFQADNYRLAYRFDVYASSPLKRSYIFVDAANGAIVLEQNRILDVNIQATAMTVYSGAKTMMTDSTAGHYRLRETGRGNGIETYNMTTTMNYTTTDFTNATTTWNNVNAAQDQYATDAHWGAEKTYDFYDSTFNRNSIDNLGLKLLSYVHYSTNYLNAFWDGTRMTYGDGSGTYNPLTALDITGHEITHGLTQYTAALAGGNEPGAMNEGFSDCMGNSIRHFGKQSTTIDWLIADEIGGAPFRDMKNPKSLQNPDTYLGQYWDFATQEVHQNSTILSHCYYIVTMRDSGVNDNTDTFNVVGLGIAKAEAIWFRMQTVYLFPNAQYADARTYSIQAATDLYGACTPEVITVTNAWYAVGVGAKFSPVVTSNFATIQQSSCSLPDAVMFTNTSSNAGTFLWHFGDGDTSTAAHPTHIYNTAGTFTVELFVDGGTCGTDSLIRVDYITINPPAQPTVTSPDTINCGDSLLLTANGPLVQYWYHQPTGGSVIDTGATFQTPPLNGSTTYYVATTIANANVFDTPHDSALGGGSFNNYDHYIFFDVNAPCTLVSVKVYAQGTGDRIVRLYDPAGNLIDSVIANLPIGESRITLNFPLITAPGYTISCEGNVHLYRNSQGAVYPYTDPSGSISITGNDADQTRFYFYYDWEISPAPCTSARVPIVVVVNNGVTPSFTSVQSSLTYTFTNTSTNSTTWNWSFGDGDTSTMQNPVHTYLAYGTYHVTLRVSNGSCTDSVTETIVISNVGISTFDNSVSFSIFPNPANDFLTIELQLSAVTSPFSIKIMDMVGQIMASNTIHPTVGQNVFNMNIGSLPQGIYILEMEGANGKMVKKIVKE